MFPSSGFHSTYATSVCFKILPSCNCRHHAHLPLLGEIREDCVCVCVCLHMYVCLFLQKRQRAIIGNTVVFSFIKVSHTFCHLLTDPSKFCFLYTSVAPHLTYNKGHIYVLSSKVFLHRTVQSAFTRVITGD